MHHTHSTHTAPAHAHHTHQQVESAGGWVKLADVASFPVSEHVSGALLRLAPGALRMLHWHLGFSEWQYVVNGTVTAGVFAAPGRYPTASEAVGVPARRRPWVRPQGFNPSDSADTFVVLVFDAGRFTNVDVSALGALPAAALATTVGVSQEFVRGGVDWRTRSGIEPAAAAAAGAAS